MTLRRPAKSPKTSGPSPSKGDAEATSTVAAYDAACQSMVDFGTGLAAKYSRDSAVLEFEKGLSVFFSHGAKSGTSDRSCGRLTKCSFEAMKRSGPIPSAT